MKIEGIKRVLLLIVVSISIYVLISWCVLKFVEPPINALLIVIFTPLFGGIVGVVIKMTSLLIGNAEKKKRDRISLKSELKSIIGYMNADNQYLIKHAMEFRLINAKTFPPKIRRKITKYNERVEDFVELTWGCEEFVKNVVIKNVLMHLPDVVNDGENIIPWTIRGYGSESRLSTLLGKVLKDKIIKGNEINKYLIDNIDSTFYSEIVHYSSIEDFDHFLRDLDEDVCLQRKYGCLKLLARIREEAKEFVKDLQGDKNVQKW